MKTIKIILLLGIIILTLISNSLYAQGGLDKTRKELLAFINRPAYAKLYPNIKEHEDSIICLSENGHTITSYHFNKYGRCNVEMYGLLTDDKNYMSNWIYFESYLKACGYEKALEVDNKYEDIRTRTEAYIERSGDFLVTLFKKY